MLKVKADILLFLISLTYLIFTKKIVIASTCLIGVVLFLWLCKFHLILITCHKSWHSVSLDVWRNIVLAIKKSKHLYYNALSNKFLEYEAKWNVVKMNCGKCDRKYCLFFSQLLIFRIYTVGSKLLYLGKVLLWEMIFYIVCTDDSVIDRQKFCRYGWGNLFRKSSVDGGENLVVSNRDRNYSRAKK
jgi:hypothetical protein